MRGDEVGRHRCEQDDDGHRPHGDEQRPADGAGEARQRQAGGVVVEAGEGLPRRQGEGGVRDVELAFERVDEDEDQRDDPDEGQDDEDRHQDVPARPFWFEAREL